MSVCPYCKWEIGEILLNEENVPAARGYKTALKLAPRMIINAVLRYSHK